MTAESRDHLGELRRHGLMPEHAEAVFVAGSWVRGWGNPSSDLDLYVICTVPWSGPGSAVMPVALRPDFVTVETTRVGQRRWDVQYWLDDQVDQVLAKISWDEYHSNAAAYGMLTSHEADFLDRLTYAVPLSGAAWLDRRRTELESSALQAILVSRALHLATLFTEDAIGQLQLWDVESSVLSARLALGWAVRALLADNGAYAQSGKWIARQMREIDQKVLSFDDYWALETMRSYRPEDPGRWVDEVLAVCRRIALAVSV